MTGGAGGGIIAAGRLCTSGYAVRYGLFPLLIVTAGHCAQGSSQVYTESGARWYGRVIMSQLASLGDGPVDMGFITGASYAGRIFTGGVSSASSAAVVGAGDAVQGYPDYGHSGRTTGENCGHTAVDVNAQVCTATGCKYPVVAFTGGVMARAGDSGAPFYVKNTSNQAWIRGHVIAANAYTSFAEKWSIVAISASRS